MNSDEILRKQLLDLLQGGHAHMTFDEAVKDFPLKRINTKFPNSTYTPWRLLEHIRITQYDILDFIQNPNYQELEWPKDYWPKENDKGTKNDWEETIKKYHEDLKALERIVMDKKVNLYEKIPHGSGQTIIREILLVADHSAYHIGEFAIARSIMRTWRK